MEEQTSSNNLAQIIVREHPLATPNLHVTECGFSVSELKSHLPVHNGLLPKVSINGEDCVDDYVVKADDFVEVDFIPQADGGLSAFLIYLTAGLAAGYLTARLFLPTLSQDAPDDVFNRIRGLRNSERLYETVPLLLGKRKVAPHYIARPYTLLEGDDEQFYALMSAGYGPLKLEDWRIGEVPLSEFDHDLTVLDHFENTSVGDVWRAYPSDISQEQVEVELENVEGETPPWVFRSSAPNPEQIILDLSFPTGCYRTNSEGKRRNATVGIDVEIQNEQGDWIRAFPSIKSLAEYTSFGSVTPVPFQINAGTVFADDQNGVAPPVFYIANQNITNVNQIADRATEITNAERVRRWVSGSYTSVLGFENPLYRYSAFIEGLDTNSLVVTGRGTRQFFESLKFYPDQEGVVNVRVRKGFASHYTSETAIVFDQVFFDNIKTARPLNFQDFQTAIGGRRPLLRYTDSNGVRQTVETFKPTVFAIRIKASGQFNGALDNLFVDATMCVPQDKDADWRGWSNLPLEPSQNPADAYKWLLQGPANYSPVALDKINHANLAEWRQRCIDEDWTIAALIDYESTLLAELQNVAYVGRAEWSFVDGQFGVVEKIERTLPVQMFTPRNSQGFQSTRNYPEEVDGIKFEWDSAEIDYEKDEGTFFDPAKEGNNELLRGRFRRLPLWGVDNFDQAYRLARFEYYEEQLQREVYTLKTDLEGLRCKRGNLVYIQNDTIEVGLGSGRIKSIAGNVITLDDFNNADEGGSEQLAVTFRTPQGDFYISDATYLGDGEWEIDDLDADTEVGDLCVYGVKGQEVLPCIVKDISYEDDLVVNLTLVNAANEIFSFDGNPVPEYEGFLRPRIEETNPEAPTLYDQIAVDANRGVVSLSLSATDLARSQGLTYRVQARIFEDEQTRDGLTINEGWFTVASGLDSQLEFSVGEIETGVFYEFRVQARRSITHVSAWSNYVFVEIPDGDDLPQVSGAAFSHGTSGTLLSWDRIENIYLAEYEIRSNTNFGDDNGLIATARSNVYNLGYITAAQTVYIAAKNAQGGYGSFATLNVSQPSVGTISSVSLEQQTFDVEITWDTPSSDYPVSSYKVEVLDGSAFITLAVINSTSYSHQPSESDTYEYRITPVDLAGNEGGSASNSINFTKPVFTPESDFNDTVDRIDVDIEEARQGIRNLDTRTRNQGRGQEEANAEVVRSVADAAIKREELRERQRLNERLIDAVVEIDPESGTITNKAFAYTDENFTQAQVLIDGVAGQVQLAVERISINEDEIQDLNSELLLLPAQITATATSVSTNVVAEALAALQPAFTFNFFDNAQGWVAVNGTLATTTASQIDLTLGDIENDSIEYDGEENPAIRIDIERAAGDGWVGDVIVEFDDSTTQTFSGIIEEPIGTTRVIRSLDFRGMTAYEGQIVRLRLVFGATTADEFIVRSITIGKADAQTQELAELSARVAQAELDIDANTGLIGQRVTVTQYQADQANGVLITNSNFSQTLNADEGYGEIVGTYEEILADGTIAKANTAGLFIGSFEGTFEAYAESVQNQFDGLGNEYATITFVNSELDAQRGTITDSVLRINKLDNIQQDALINQTNALADYAAYLAGQTDVRINFSRAVSQLQADVSPEGALAQSITDLEASVATERGRITATNTLLQQARVDIDGNAESLATIASGITGEEDEGQALLRLETLLNEGGLTARAFLGTDVNGRVTGIVVQDDGVENVIAFQSGAVVFNDNDNNPAIFFDTTNNRYSFTGEIIADAGTFGGLLRGGSIAIGGTEQEPNFEVDIDGNISVKQGSIDLGGGTFTVDNNGNLSASNADITGKITSQEGTIGSWIIGTDTISSAESGARIVLDKPNNRMGIYDGSSEKVAVGYLGGLLDPSGNPYASNQYGIYVAEGDEMVVDGRITQEGGSWLIEEDASIRIQRANETDIIRLGTDSGNKGLFLYDSSENVIGEFSDNRIFFGDSDQFLQVQNGNITFSGAINNDKFSVSANGEVVASDITITGGSLEIGNNFSVDNQGNLVATSADISGDITITDGSINLGNGVFTVDSAGAMTATDATISGSVTADSGSIGGWGITSDLMRSAVSGSRIELNPSANRVSVFDAVNEKVAMGYLGGLPKYDGSGNWSNNDYGFWARQGDNLIIDGNIQYENGDFLIENDATLKIQTGEGQELIWLGTDSGSKGLFIYDGTAQQNVLARFTSGEVFVGDGNESLTYTPQDGLVITGNIAGGTITIGNNFSVDDQGNLEASNATLSGSITSDSGNIGGWNITSTAISSGVSNQARITLGASTNRIRAFNSSNQTQWEISPTLARFGLSTGSNMTWTPQDGLNVTGRITGSQLIAESTSDNNVYIIDATGVELPSDNLTVWAGDSSVTPANRNKSNGYWWVSRDGTYRSNMRRARNLNAGIGFTGSPQQANLNLNVVQGETEVSADVFNFEGSSVNGTAPSNVAIEVRLREGTTTLDSYTIPVTITGQSGEWKFEPNAEFRPLAAVLDSTGLDYNQTRSFNVQAQITGTNLAFSSANITTNIRAEDSSVN